jgi:Fe-S-cluster containining protein
MTDRAKMDAQELIAAQAARGADPATMANARAKLDAINARLPKEAMAALARRAMTAPARAKIIMLRRMTDHFGAAVGPAAPCKRGCDACCHMATLVTVEEATLIARQTGAKMTMPARFNEVLEKAELRERHNGVPCTFLTRGGCAIYAERPLACRMHYTLDADNLLCHIVPGHPANNVPMANTRELDMLIMKAHGGPYQIRYADIREFFPKGLGK